MLIDLADMEGLGHLSFGMQADETTFGSERLQPIFEIVAATVERRAPFVAQNEYV